MIASGYMAKRIGRPSGWNGPSHVLDIYSVSGHVSDDFADYISFWKHNGYWLFDSPELIRAVAAESKADLKETQLFYYEVYEYEFDGEQWKMFAPETSFKTEVEVPSQKKLEGFDVVTFSCHAAPECSPLSCNTLAKEIRTNSHCLVESFDEAKRHLESGVFNDSEPGPYRIFAVYSVGWEEV